MTTEEAIRLLDLNREYLKNTNNIGLKDDIEALNMAIQALQAQADGDLISRQAVIDAIMFEDKWLHDAKGHNKDTEIAFSGMYKAINNLPTWETTEAVIKRSGFLKFIAENMNPNEYQWYYEQYYHTTDEKVGGQNG